MTDSHPTPRDEYAARLAQRQAQQYDLRLRFGLFHAFRWPLLGVLIVLIVLAEKERLLGKLIVLGPPLLLVDWIDRRRRRYASRWREAAWRVWFCERQLARVQGEWAGQPESGARYLDEGHLCAVDLDLFGPGSLFQRLATPATRAGEDTLANWLLSPASVAEVRRRQEAVSELRVKLDLREDLAFLAHHVPENIDFAPLARWSGQQATPPSIGVRVLLGGLAGLTLVGLATWAIGWTGPGWMAGGLAALLIQARILRGRTEPVLGAVEGQGAGLRGVCLLMRRVEGECFDAALLTQVQGTLAQGQSARRVRQLGWLIALVPWARFVGLGPHLALAMDSWRRESGAEFGAWLSALGALEALSALAGYAYENPQDPFPELREGGPAGLEAVALGHPLLPAGRCVPNDVALGEGVAALLVVSGSNMAGKSTFLRTVGINVVLALAGAPVRATRLALTPLVVGATLRVQDSLQEGRSRFYAEILRVRVILEKAKGEPSVLFLLDELFQGTNSHDRRVGAAGVLARLLDRGAVGLVTTHDLSLTDIAETLAPRAANVHFADTFAGGEVTFDYKLRPGVVQTTNGLALMRAVGIEV